MFSYLQAIDSGGDRPEKGNSQAAARRETSCQTERRKPRVSWCWRVFNPSGSGQRRCHRQAFNPFSGSKRAFIWYSLYIYSEVYINFLSSCRCSVRTDRGSFGQNYSRGGKQRAFCGLRASLQRRRQKRPEGVCARTQIRPVAGAQSGEQPLVCLRNRRRFPYPRINAIHNIIITRLIILNPAELELG